MTTLACMPGPRHMALTADGARLVVGGELGNNLTVLEIDRQNRRLVLGARFEREEREKLLPLLIGSVFRPLQRALAAAVGSHHLAVLQQRRIRACLRLAAVASHQPLIASSRAEVCWLFGSLPTSAPVCCRPTTPRPGPEPLSRTWRSQVTR